MTSAIVHSQQFSPWRGDRVGVDCDAGPDSILAALRRWNEEAWMEMLGRHRSMIAWGCELVRSFANVESWARKLSVLNRRLLAVSVAANESCVRAGLEQQRAAAHWCDRVPVCFRPGAIPALRTLAASAWPGATESAQGWAMIPIAAGVRIASAWADFWSLPSGASGEDAATPYIPITS